MKEVIIKRMHLSHRGILNPVSDHHRYTKGSSRDARQKKTKRSSDRSFCVYMRFIMVDLDCVAIPMPHERLARWSKEQGVLVWTSLIFTSIY